MDAEAKRRRVTAEASLASPPTVRAPAGAFETPARGKTDGEARDGGASGASTATPLDEEESARGRNGGRDGFCGDADVRAGAERRVEREWGGLGARGGRAGGDSVPRRATVGVAAADEGVDVAAGAAAKAGAIVRDVVRIHAFARGHAIRCERAGRLRGAGDAGARGTVRDDSERVGRRAWVAHDRRRRASRVISESRVRWRRWAGSRRHRLSISVRVRGRPRALGVESVFADGRAEISRVSRDDERKRSVRVLLRVQ